MRDSTDPGGSRQPYYASGVAQPETPQPTGPQQPQQPETFETPQSTQAQQPRQAPETFDTPQGATGAEQVRAGTDAPTTQSGPVQAQQTTSPESGMTQGTGTAQDTGIPQGAGIWDTTKADEFRHRWHDVQTHFVEDPRGSVTEARQLVDEAVQSLADSVHNREEQLERAGARSSDSTEGMRDTVLQYHQLLDRLLTV
ncbi:hypothetical protein ACFO1B_19495 [Dactylosporangium siamense]|uniref:Uncharacterized protein n=1 Tax=Dactylosporangium siamense TaxID=685454 RepID=A0A919PHK2_9ACTN|nr:hypothetical protein [Dactylosporangium siamense]GIG44069.1 hypothetical protein Dsi01nite_021100 [Dactylosporangium siamense]